MTTEALVLYAVCAVLFVCGVSMMLAGAVHAVKGPPTVVFTEPDHSECEAEAASLRARLKRAVTMRRKAFRQWKRRQ